MPRVLEDKKKVKRKLKEGTSHNLSYAYLYIFFLEEERGKVAGQKRKAKR